MVVETQQEPHTVGELIRFWRNRRRLSQLELALEASLSTKHLSFVETGRSRPSRQLLIHLAQRLDLPMAERNRLLLAGGFAPPYLEEAYDGKVMQPLRESLRRLLDAHQPNPALIVDGLWNLIEANPAASLLWDGVDPALLEPPINMLRLAVHPDGLPRISSMTAACNTRSSISSDARAATTLTRRSPSWSTSSSRISRPSRPLAPSTSPWSPSTCIPVSATSASSRSSPPWERRSRSPRRTSRLSRSCRWTPRALPGYGSWQGMPEPSVTRARRPPVRLPVP